MTKVFAGIRADPAYKKKEAKKERNGKQKKELGEDRERRK
jgi:hypothetical protein